MRRFSTVPFKGTKEQEAQLRSWLEEHKATPGVAMPALQKAQEIYGYLPIEVQRPMHWVSLWQRFTASLHFTRSSACARRASTKSAYVLARHAM